MSAVLNQVFLFVLCSFLQPLPNASILSCFHISKRIKILPLPFFMFLCSLLLHFMFCLFIFVSYFFVWLVCLLYLKAILVLSVCFGLRHYIITPYALRDTELHLSDALNTTNKTLLISFNKQLKSMLKTVDTVGKKVLLLESPVDIGT
jgi:hypothetical protein